MATTREKFQQKIRVEPETQCWRWIAKSRRFKAERMTIPYRFAYEEWNNVRLESSDIVIRECGNQLCVNPDHMRIGTQSDAAYIGWQRRQEGNTEKDIEDFIRRRMPSISDLEINMALIMLGLRDSEPLIGGSNTSAIPERPN